MIEYRNIVLKFNNQLLFDGIDLHIQQGSKVVLHGPSGCGKSSLLKCAVGAIPLQNGSVQLGDIPLSPSTLSDIRSRIAFIGQEPVLGAETVKEALLLPFSYHAHKHNKPEKSRISELLQRLHLSEHILEKPCKHISGGEKQRIAIARALLLNKHIFLADEITSALDSESRTAVMNELFQSDITLLSVSHDPQWMNTCDRIIEIQNSKLQEVHA
ncbi:MAG TPA: ATP-binding cassette domain-containing protein [Pontiella sp.]